MSRTIRVKPLPKSERRYNTRWQVLVSGARKSKHRTKENAREKAKRIMRAADTVIVHKSNGSKQEEFSGPAA